MKSKHILFTLTPIALPALAWVYGPRDPAWHLMWTLAFSCYFGCKILTLNNLPPKTLIRHILIHLLLHPGMDPEAFLQAHLMHTTNPQTQQVRTRRAHLLRAGIRNILLGLIWLLVLPRMLRGTHDFWAAWSAMVGLIHLLHFGLYHLLAWFWQGRGFGAAPLMINPLAASSLGDFWGRRWNRAFHQLTHRYLFTPLCRGLNAPVALLLSFLASGLIHELVITVPARDGHGGPTTYFLLQGIGVLIERTPGFRRRPFRRRVFAFLTVLLPVPLLFPAVFVQNVIIPMFHAWGVLPHP